jgi:GNAT superfamily N-acetyltransferase
VIEVRQVRDHREKHRFLTFPWQVYRGDPLWVPPIFSEREKATDPQRGLFFRNGYADFFIAYRNGAAAGTLCCSHEHSGDAHECSLGFFECIDDFAVAGAMFETAEAWARQHGLSRMCGTYNLDREDGRGILIEGRDRPPVVLCGHNPPYYGRLFEQYGFTKQHDDGLAYAVRLDEHSARFQRLYRLAAEVSRRRDFVVRPARMHELDAEIDRILVLQNRALEHLDGTPYSRPAIEAMVLPLKDLADPELVLFVEADGQAIGWFPAIANFNEILIRLGGLRRPWDYITALRHRNLKPKCLAVKSVAVLPEYWDTGAAILLFAEMAQRAIARGFAWMDLSLTGEDNPDTWDIAHHMDGKIYKRYRFFKKELSS